MGSGELPFDIRQQAIDDAQELRLLPFQGSLAVPDRAFEGQAGADQAGSVDGAGEPAEAMDQLLHRGGRHRLPEFGPFLLQVAAQFGQQVLQQGRVGSDQAFHMADIEAATRGERQAPGVRWRAPRASAPG